MSLPVNFLYLGGDKCGSTWLYNILSRHPEVSLACAKELFYFDRFYEKGAGWYAKQFPSRKGATRIGEICHDYLYSELALKRISQDMPSDSRFLIFVRSPIERAVSHYNYLKKIGHTSDSFANAIIAHPQTIEQSMFGRYVAKAHQYLGADRVHVLHFDLLRHDPVGFGKAVSAALDISFLEELPYSERVLAARASRHPQLVRVSREIGWLVRRLGAPRVVGWIKSSRVVGSLLYSKQKPDPVVIDDELRLQLEEKFLDDQKLLFKLVPNLKWEK